MAMSGSAPIDEMDAGEAHKFDANTVEEGGEVSGDETDAALETSGYSGSTEEVVAADAGSKNEASDVQTSGSSSQPAVAERTARLLITKLEMENFKSYGGLREIGPFHKCFSSIVGPNGSGKSNVIDAMLFVFGKRAKKLRLNKVSELIHRSDTYPNLEHARVSVHFVDILDMNSSEDDYEEVPGTELVVTRTAYMNNQSKYQVDGKNATFGEVGALLRKRGVDLDNNRFLILQGEVEQIAMMKPKALTPHEEGLLEYLEDIIGSDRFVEAAEEAVKVVDALNEQRTEKLNRLKLAEKERDSLEGAREEAQEYLRLDASIREKLNVLYQTMVAYAAANVEKVELQGKEKKQRLEYERTKLATTLKEVEELKEVHEKMTSEYDVLKAEMVKTKEEFNEYERLDIKHKERVKGLKDQIRKLETAIKKDDKCSADSLARAEELEGSLDRLGQAVSQGETRKASEDAALEEVNESLKGKTAELREELESEQKEAKPIREEADALRNKVENCKCEINLVRESTESAKKRLKNAEKALSALLEKAEADKVELAGAKKDSRTMEAQIGEAGKKVDQARHDVAAATQAMTKAVAAAEEAKAARESAAGKSAALRALLEASAEGGPLHGAGVCGRLGDLGVIGAEHDAAVSSCSGTLDHVVVETAEGATACVEFLRTNNLGRASFVILEKLGHLESALSRPFRAPPRCPRLFDLLNISEPRFRPAFYLALRDTLVAPDLDIATATAYEKGTGRCLHRMVTSIGQLIERSGAMTGGGNSIRRGAMRTSGGGAGRGGGGGNSSGGSGGIVSAAQAERLVREAREAEDAVRAARLVKKDAETELKKLHARSRELQTLIPKLEMRLKGVGASEAQCREQIESLQAQCRLTPEAEAKLEDLRAGLAADEAALAKVSKSLQKAEAAVKALQQAILDVGGEKLKKAVKRADAASRALDEAVEALNRATVEGQGERTKAEKSSKDAERRRSKLEKLREDKTKTMEDFSELENKASVVLVAMEKAQDDASQKGKELQVIVEAYDKARSLADKIRDVEVDITHQLGEYDKVIKDNKHTVKHWTSELKKLRELHKKEADDWGLDDDDHDDVTDGEEEEGDDVNGAEEVKGDSASEREQGDAVNVKGKAKEGMVSRHTKARGAGILAELSPEELEDVDREALKLEIGELETHKKAKESSVNLPALALYRKREQDYHVRVKDLEEVTQERNQARGRHEELRRQRLEEFMAGFGQITLRLKEMYQMITLGGDAELELVDSLDPFSEGIVFSVRPPKKSWKNIANLSGGEKTLSSLALVFALHHFKPTPLYVMDEIDAALDFKNVSIVANYIKERTKNAQFIIISLRNNMFELADRLVGIYKTHNVTKSVTINPKQFAQQQKQHQQQQQKLKVSGVLGDATNNAARASPA